MIHNLSGYTGMGLSAPTHLLVSGRPVPARLPCLASNGAAAHYGTTWWPSLVPHYMPFAFRTQCCPGCPGQRGLPCILSAAESHPKESECILEAPRNGTASPESGGLILWLLPSSSAVPHTAFLSSHREAASGKCQDIKHITPPLMRDDCLF